MTTNNLPWWASSLAKLTTVFDPKKVKAADVERSTLWVLDDTDSYCERDSAVLLDSFRRWNEMKIDAEREESMRGTIWENPRRQLRYVDHDSIHVEHSSDDAAFWRWICVHGHFNSPGVAFDAK